MNEKASVIKFFMPFDIENKINTASINRTKKITVKYKTNNCNIESLKLHIVIFKINN